MAAEAERAARAGESQRSRRTRGRDHQGPLQRRSAAERTPVHPHRDSTGCRLPDAAFPTFVSQPRPALQPWPRLPSASALDRRSPRQKFTSRMTVRLRAGTRKCGPAQPCSHSARCHGHHGGGRKVHCASSWLTTWQSTCCVTSKRSSLLASRAAARKCEGLRRRAATSPW